MTAKGTYRFPDGLGELLKKYSDETGRSINDILTGLAIEEMRKHYGNEHVAKKLAEKLRQIAEAN